MRICRLGFTAGLIVFIVMTACSFQPAPTPILPTKTPCPYTQNPGPPPPEVQDRAQQALTALGAEGIRGSLRVEANGEYSCDKFAVEDIYFEYTIYVSDFSDQSKLKELVVKMKDSAKNSLQGWNMGKVTVRFVTGQECLWNELSSSCDPLRAITFP